MKNGMKAGLTGLVAGTIVGGGAALLFAPQSGWATRRAIARGARDARRKATGLAEEIAGTVSGAVDTVREKSAELRFRIA